MDERIVSRLWMYDRVNPEDKSLNDSFCHGLDDFITFAVNQDPQWKDGDNIRCPCTKCKNMRYHSHHIVARHLIRCEFQHGYWNWIAHGEPMWTSENMMPGEGSYAQLQQLNVPDEIQQWGNYEQMTWDQRMIFDSVMPTYDQSFNDQAGEHVSEEVQYERDPFEGQQVTTLDERWRHVFEAADRPLFEGCRTHTLLSFIGSLLYAKSEWNLPEAAFNYFNELFMDIMPEVNNCPTNYYHHRKTINDLGLPVIKIDACPNGCMLFWKEYEYANQCIWCGAQRYKEKMRRSDGKRKRIPNAILRYLPLGPRLQRLFTTTRVAEHMT